MSNQLNRFTPLMMTQMTKNKNSQTLYKSVDSLNTNLFQNNLFTFYLHLHLCNAKLHHSVYNILQCQMSVHLLRIFSLQQAVYSMS